MATKEFVINNPAPSITSGFSVGRINWQLGTGNITLVEAKLSSGNGAFNGSLRDKHTHALGWDVDALPAGTLEPLSTPLWHLRADDLSYLGDGADPGNEIPSWVSYGSDSTGVIAKFLPPSQSQRPTYRNTTGPGSLAGSEFVTGDDDILVQSAGTETMAYDADFTAFVVLGDFNSGNNRPIMGHSDTTNTSWQTLWGHKGGDLRVRTDDGDEYNHGSTDLGSDEIRCLVCENQSSSISNLSEWVDGGIGVSSPLTGLYSSEAIDVTSGSGGGWTFNAIGGIERDRNGSTQQRLYSGSLSEIILFDSALTTDQREAYEGYLAHRWGLTASLSAAHTYKSTNPYVGAGIDPDSNYLNTLQHITLGTSYTTCSSATHAISNGQILSFYMPTAQSDGSGDLTVQITYTVT